MSSLAATDSQATREGAKTIQPAWVRTMHWINAVAMILMIMSGWQIYNASPLFDFHFPKSITLGGWLGGALLWHFAATGAGCRVRRRTGLLHAISNGCCR